MLAILTTHPIQYQVPLWQALARDSPIPFEVWYVTNHGVEPSYDVQFGKSFSWDLDTLAGYSSRRLRVNAGADVSRMSDSENFTAMSNVMCGGSVGTSGSVCASMMTGRAAENA